MKCKLFIKRKNIDFRYLGGGDFTGRVFRHLNANRPIIVGVNHTLNKGYNEGTTDHWIVIVGRGYDTTQQQYYYTYMDTGRYATSDGCNMTNNRLYYDSKNYIFQDAKAGTNNNKKYDVTQVRPNDGKNLSETINQPTKY